MTPAIVLLLAALANLAWFLKGRRIAWLRWRRWDVRPSGHGAARHRRFARHGARTFWHFGVFSLVALLLAGRAGNVGTVPAEFAPVRSWVIEMGGGTLAPGTLGWATFGGIALGGTLAGLLERYGRRVMLGDIESVLPATRGELAWGVVLAVDAGVCEELFFRLLVPLLVSRVTGDALAGMAAAVVLFGLAHRYQGWAGMVATALVGVLLAAVYLSSGSLMAAIVLHIAIDLNALVLRPVISGRVRLW